MSIYKLDSCVWEITLECCFSCAYCGSRAGQARPNELSTSECLSVVDQLAKLGCRRVSLIGGEVFMREDWEEIVSALTQKGIRTAIITNGFLFHDRLLSRLKACQVESVAVSIDGTKDLHDRYRQEGSFDRAVTAIRALTGAGIPASVISTLNKENVETLEDLYQILSAENISAWQLQACSPMGNAALSGIDYHFDFNKVIRFVERHLPEAPFLLGIADNIGYFTESEGSLRGIPDGHSPFRGCRAGLSAIGIDSTGNVRGCESMYDDAFIEGNVRTRSLIDIWNDPDAFAYNRKFTRDLLTGPCHDCPEGYRCAAGCRSYNYFVHHKPYEAPWCART